MINDDFPDCAKKIFYEIYQRLSYKYGCVYFSYYVEIYQYQRRLSFTTSPQWTQLFIQNGLNKNCPLMQVGWNFRKVILDWDTAPIKTSAQSNVMGIRAEFGHAHGISFSNKAFGTMESLGMAADKTNKSFKTLILESITEVSETLTKFSCIAHKALQLKGLNNQHQPSFHTMPLALLASEIKQKPAREKTQVFF